MFWQTASKTDVLLAHSGTILMCHLISNHTVLLQKKKRKRSERGEKERESASGSDGIWKVQRKNGNWGRRGKRGGGEGVRGCRGKEISVSAKVFIKILRQMISVSFSWSCLGRHAISMQITTSRLCSYYFCWSCCNMTQERRRGEEREGGRESLGDMKWERGIRRKMQ